MRIRDDSNAVVGFGCRDMVAALSDGNELGLSAGMRSSESYRVGGGKGAVTKEKEGSGSTFVMNGAITSDRTISEDPQIGVIRCLSCVSNMVSCVIAWEKGWLREPLRRGGVDRPPAFGFHLLETSCCDLGSAREES